MNAAYKRKTCIEMEDIVSSILRMLYDSPNDFIQASESERRALAFHEAAHAVMSDILLPGSVGLVSIRPTENNSISGFIRKCRPSPKNAYDILISLAGKAASELISGTCSFGCSGWRGCS